MSAEFTYKCDYCDKHLGHKSPDRGGQIWGDLAKTLLGGENAWHACSDICLVRLFEGWVTKIKARVTEQLEAERGSGWVRINGSVDDPGRGRDGHALTGASKGTDDER